MLERMARLLEVMALLRDPWRGGPWDRSQTMRSLVPHTLEEAYEVAEAVEQGGMDDIRDELGDLLFQVVFYSEIARESGWFDFEDVAAAITNKLERRHPHVFEEGERPQAHRLEREWEWHKREERDRRARLKGDEPPGILGGVAKALPALSRAVKLQKRAARAGFDWDGPAQVMDKVLEELDEVRREIDAGDARRLRHEVGDLLLAVSNLARHLEVDPEQALRSANSRFERRFHIMERLLAEEGKRMEEAAPEHLESLWLAAKARDTEDGPDAPVTP
ncbi:MAG TPA: nucleoside triphosphate pyrophosphohydrolase [Chromatiales bacterium]|nr:nucleoside triphosphate pyrophosphohydrolase [Chromatiales bacterium]